MRKYHSSFSPAARTLSRVRATLAAWAKDCGFSDADASDIVYAAGEAFDNAIEHGHDELFVVEGRCDDGTLTVKIHDQGPGLSSAPASRPRNVSVLPERGLGIFIMNALMDETRFEGRADGGVTVTLVKRRDRGTMTVPS